MFAQIKNKTVQLVTNPQAAMMLRLAILALLTIAMLVAPETAFAGTGSGNNGG
jgi:hypothetical protein